MCYTYVALFTEHTTEIPPETSEKMNNKYYSLISSEKWKQHYTFPTNSIHYLSMLDFV